MIVGLELINVVRLSKVESCIYRLGVGHSEHMVKMFRLGKAGVVGF